MRLITYYGFLENKKVLLSGKLVKGNFEKPKATDSKFKNTISMIKQYFTIGMANKTVKIIYGKQTKEVKTNQFGTFKAYFENNNKSNYTVIYKDKKRISKVFLPKNKQLAIITDIDDTFLVTYSTSFFKRIWTNMTKNFNTRSPVKNIINIYKNFSGPIFYISNSQWRLFEALDGFRKINDMPIGPFILRGTSKYNRIKSILNSYPYKFILIGDDGQKDPEEYTKIQNEFPKKIYAIAIRHVSSKNRFDEVKQILTKSKSIVSQDEIKILNFIKEKIEKY